MQKLNISTLIFTKILAKRKLIFAISEKTLAETIHYIPKGLHKGNPFQGPFTQFWINNKNSIIFWSFYK